MELQQANAVDPFYNQMLQFFDDFDKGFGWDNSMITRPEQRVRPQIARVQGFCLDMRETDDMFRLCAELPGISKADLDLSVDGRILHITAEKKHSQNIEEGDKWLKTERVYGKMQRSLRMPESADLDRIEASLVDGVLDLKIPKREMRSERKRIQVM